MKIRIAALLSGIALASSAASHTAFSQSAAEKTGINSMIGTSPTTADFVKEATISDMFEIQSSMLAVNKGDTPTKTFATQMVLDHKKTTAEMASMLKAGTVPGMAPTAMDSMHQNMLDKLKGLSGADFTHQYHSDQVTAHKEAVSLFQRYAKGGDNAALKSWAAQTEPSLEHHLQMAQNLDKS